MAKEETLEQVKQEHATDDEGVPASELDDETLRAEVQNLHRTREETFLNGSPQALRRHTERMLALEEEYARRFRSETEPDDDRTRAGARARAGQDPNAEPSEGREGNPTRFDIDGTGDGDGS